MRIVVLDALTINPGDLKWDSLQKLGNCTIFDRTPTDQLLARAEQAEILLTNKTVLNESVIKSLPLLRYIGVMATGYNVVCIEATEARNVLVTNVPAYGTAPVAQATFALLLELTNRVGHHSRTVHDGKWTKSIDFCYWDYPQVELADLTIGIIGFGAIGQAVAQLARAFGMKVLISSRRGHRNDYAPDMQFCDMDTLFINSDVVSLHCPLTEDTRELINKTRLKQMKPSAFLLNTARGQLINELDLAEALKSGRIAGAGLDVLSAEPPTGDNPLLDCPNCIITPHIAWATRSARQRLLDTCVANLQAYLSGNPVNVVNRPRSLVKVN